MKEFDNLQDVAGKEPLFLSVPKRIGHDQRGSFVPLRDEDGDVIVKQVVKKRYFRDSEGEWKEELYDIAEPVSNDDLPKVLDDLKTWLKEVDI